MESWRKTSLVLPTPPVAYSGTIRITCSGTMRIRENEQHYEFKTTYPTYVHMSNIFISREKYSKIYDFDIGNDIPNTLFFESELFLFFL